MNVKILADSAADLSNDYYKELNIEVIPLHVNIAGTDYLDSQTITPKQMYDFMRAGERPTTSQAAPQAFESAFTECAKTNQPLIYFSLSSPLSGTYGSAKIMEKQIKEKYPDAPLYLVDTKSVTLGYGLVVIRAAKLANEGATVEEILDIGTYHANHMEHIFTVDDLEYLYRSGRLSRAASFIGSLLSIKPILHVVDGKLVPYTNVRGSKRLLSRILKIAEERGVDFENQVIGISHGDDMETAEKLASMLKEKLGVNEVVIEMIGSSVGVHSGPGALALFFLNKPYK